MIVKLSSK